jgi:hypothetical protein
VERAALPALIAILTLAAGCATEKRAAAVRVGGTGNEGDPCWLEVNGERIDREAFPAIARRSRGEADIAIDPATTYRCVGGIIYELQRAGARRIGFISEPSAR